MTDKMGVAALVEFVERLAKYPGEARYASEVHEQAKAALSAYHKAPVPAVPQVEITAVPDPMHRGRHIFSLRCPHGHAFSATAGDYFMKQPGADLLCYEDHSVAGEDEEDQVGALPLRLTEKVYIFATDEAGHRVIGKGWRTLQEGVTVDDLRALAGMG